MHNSDASQQLKGVKCKCIDVLNIVGHGEEGGGVQGVGNKDSLAVRDSKVVGLELFQNLKPKFCKPCTIYLRGCNAALGENGRRLLQAVANATGCTTKGWDSPTTILTPYQGLPGDGFLGLFNGPDLTVEPQ